MLKAYNHEACPMKTCLHNYSFDFLDFFFYAANYLCSAKTVTKTSSSLLVESQTLTDKMSRVQPLLLASCVLQQDTFTQHSATGLGSSVGRVSAPRSEGTGFDPEPRHTKVVNNGTIVVARRLALRLGLVDPVSV